MLQQVPEAPPAGVPSSYSVPRPWITVDGVRWHLRGDVSHRDRHLHRLLGRHDLLVFHDQAGERTLLAPPEREAFWSGAVSRMQDSEHSAVVGHEYVDPEGRRCLVVYEFC